MLDDSLARASPARSPALLLEGRKDRAISEDGQQGGSWCGTALGDVGTVSRGTVLSENLEGMKGIPGFQALAELCPARTYCHFLLPYS